MKVISPVYSPNFTKKFIKDYIENQKVTAINLGSGSTNIHPDIINVDCYDYENVNIICDINSLPFADSSIDRILNAAVLEHIPSPACAVDEMKRALKPGGIVCCYMPFIVGFHASPSDYSRLTIEGLRILFKDFEIISLNVCGGPTSGMLWIFQEWLAMILSFGSKKLYLILYLIIMAVTWPIKFIDVFLIKHSKASNIASGFLVTAKKRKEKMNKKHE
jgi:SAM-dependent methyltransferase